MIARGSTTLPRASRWASAAPIVRDRTIPLPTCGACLRGGAVSLRAFGALSVRCCASCAAELSTIADAAAREAFAPVAQVEDEASRAIAALH